MDSCLNQLFSLMHEIYQLVGDGLDIRVFSLTYIRFLHDCLTFKQDNKKWQARLLIF